MAPIASTGSKSSPRAWSRPGGRGVAVSAHRPWRPAWAQPSVQSAAALVMAMASPTTRRRSVATASPGLPRQARAAATQSALPAEPNAYRFGHGPALRMTHLSLYLTHTSSSSRRNSWSLRKSSRLSASTLISRRPPSSKISSSTNSLCASSVSRAPAAAAARRDSICVGRTDARCAVLAWSTRAASASAVAAAKLRNCDSLNSPMLLSASSQDWGGGRSTTFHPPRWTTAKASASEPTFALLKRNPAPLSNDT
mmetsp:Transcript_24796/g.69769  ORF Transcript_24796/g.69769 Transcript_24796/m.69769 type:complete len:254 (+) Transcript_24796:559-1320(+)